MFSISFGIYLSKSAILKLKLLRQIPGQIYCISSVLLIFFSCSYLCCDSFFLCSLCVLCPMLPVSLDCQFVIAHSVILWHMITCEIIYAFVVVSVLSISIYLVSKQIWLLYINILCKIELLIYIWKCMHVIY